MDDHSQPPITGRVETLYARLKEMTVNFHLRPGERINEVTLAKQLNASRTPLREALNRLVTERLIDFRPGRGFFCRDLDASSIYDLYEMREVIEIAAVRRAIQRASDAGIEACRATLYGEGLTYSGKTVGEVTAFDEAFHIHIARLSENDEIVYQLERINERIRFIRWIDMASRVDHTKAEHKAIMKAMGERDADLATKLMQGHIVKRMDQIVAAVREGYSNIYVAEPRDLFDRAIEIADA